MIGTDGLAAPGIVAAVVAYTGLSTAQVTALLIGLGTGGVSAATGAVAAGVSAICHAIPDTCSPGPLPPQAGENEQSWMSWRPIANRVHTSPGAPITAVYRDPTHLDLFMAGTDGTCWNISWDQGTGWQNEWSTIHSNVHTTSGWARVTAV